MTWARHRRQNRFAGHLRSIGLTAGSIGRNYNFQDQLFGGSGGGFGGS
jgi:hypothetical protein